MCVHARRFFFSVTGMVPGVPYKFNLMNFRKKQSLFASGKSPLVCLAKQPSTNTSASAASAGYAGAAQALGSGQAQGATGGGAATDASGTAVVGPSAANTWVRAGAHVSYYPSPYRGRKNIPPGSESVSKRPIAKKASVKPKHHTTPTCTSPMPNVTN